MAKGSGAAAAGLGLHFIPVANPFSISHSLSHSLSRSRNAYRQQRIGILLNAPGLTWRGGLVTTAAAAAAVVT
uniref:Putative secreted protein n=1 Tax=Anopheles triannulatus TaxID=58253 RepID=A0A2M4B4D2_9DIPT